MNNDNNGNENNFFSYLIDNIDKERIKFNLSKKSDSEIIFKSPDQSIIIKFIIDYIHNRLLYDIYLSEYHKHLKKRYIYNFEKMYSLQEKHGKLHLPKYLPELWIILDKIHIWARKNNFMIKGRTMNDLNNIW